jgi:6-pyruvoyltetrahydropterin/6-carboxytetrahydropterin synthase
VTGPNDPLTGYVFDLGALSELIRKVILDEVDHRNLNTDVEWLHGLNPTAEVLAPVFWDRLETRLAPGALWSVRVGETEKNWAERRRTPSA